MKTILYLTDNSLDESIAQRCREILVREAGDNPIISVSQYPIKLGQNVCVGAIGRSWMSLFKQQLAGLEQVKTKFIAIAEHDCLYTREYFDWEPPRDDIFYYNHNHYLVEWHGNHPEIDGMYSRWSRHRNALSQLICTKQLLLDSIVEKLDLLNRGLAIMRKAGEPGAFPDGFLAVAAKWAISGRCNHLVSSLEKYVKKYTHKDFVTTIPNLDIRHKTNFTGPRRGKQRTFEIPYWGKFAEVMK